MSTGKEILAKNQVVVFLVITIVLLAGLKIKYGYRGEGESQKSKVKSQNEEVNITPTMTMVPTTDPKKDFPLRNELPYYGKGFVVEKYTSPLTLKMILNGATETYATKAVTDWINSFGDAIGQHKIEIQN
ncbi:hypothetical protein HYV64_03810 [Candidatus Shapirobacteria bacterium]|nr:hypothetical protein [Candidatus Shapirobacteria bacterium]